jgi:hypothetical protein
MPEHIRSSDALSAGPDWDVGAMSHALNDQPQERIDGAFGSGTRFRLGPGRAVELDIFPATGVVRVTAPDMQLALFDQAEPPTVASTSIVFTRSEPAHRSLAITNEGTITLVATPPPIETAKTAANDAETPKRPTGHPATEAGRTDDPAVPESMLQDPLPSDQRGGQPRVAFSGRLGRDPRCRTTPREIRVCTFPVAEKHEATETPTWLTVVAFRALAEKVEATLKKGMFVDGIGYQHERERKGRDGAARRDSELYAVVVTPR